MILLILALFLSDGTEQVLTAKVRDKATCERLRDSAKKTFVGENAGGTTVVVGAEARCVVIPRANDV